MPFVTGVRIFTPKNPDKEGKVTAINFFLFFFHCFLDSVTKTSTPSFGKNGKAAGQQGSPWETLVVFAINLKLLTVQMNMSNVMGNNT